MGSNSKADVSATGLEELWTRVEADVKGTRTLSREKLRLLPTGGQLRARDILVGLDATSDRHLLIPMPPDAPRRIDRRSRGVHVEVTPLESPQGREVYVDVACRIPELRSLYTTVAAEMVNSVLANPDRPLDTCIAVLDKWRRLLGQKGDGGLSRIELAAILGELLYVEKIVLVNPEALGSWAGPDGGIHDIVSECCALEVKMSLKPEGRFPIINGLDQLSSEAAEVLYLGFVKLRMASSGVSVPDLVRRLVTHGVDAAELYRKLSQLGYVAVDEVRYEDVRFETVEMLVYAVEENFPRLTKVDFVSGSLPNGVLGVSYQIDLSAEPPTALDPEAVQSVYLRIAGASSA